MKKLLLALGILALICSPAMAGRNAGGAIVLHNDSSIVYSGGWDYCGTFPLPPTCLDLNTNITHDPNVETLIWAVAAFPNGSSPGVTADQFGLYGDVTLDWFVAWGPCPQGALEVPDATWPAPGTGTAVAFSTPIFSQLFKLYWFACGSPGPGSQISTGVYPHGSDGAGFADDSNPPQFDRVNLFGTAVWGTAGHNECPLPPQNEACCFNDGHCQDLLADQCLQQGGHPQGQGSTCANTQCPLPPEACCFQDGTCRDLTAPECQAAGGIPQGTGSACATTTCPQPAQACCFPDGTCRDLTADECAAAGGITQPGVHCGDPGFQCPPPPATVACCFADGSCQDLTVDECTAAGGTPEADGTACATFQCPPVATTPSTWGKIKAGYR